MFGFERPLLCNRATALKDAASAVASATMTPLNAEAPPNKLVELVSKVQQYLWDMVQYQLLALSLLILGNLFLQLTVLFFCLCFVVISFTFNACFHWF
ncbi:uncharacterized protein LOC114283588 isoform X1 [Camellia sinensis]|uniref:uncharacterized protein LOC114283588 isoform X1 n=1 Tax=Camellia sinensis TaxID=4442 RepID=UPI0010359B36|nr:uncharacterized protein LOC114283588 isoform X1 [Camellia sinensis]